MLESRDASPSLVSNRFELSAAEHATTSIFLESFSRDPRSDDYLGFPRSILEGRFQLFRS